MGSNPTRSALLSQRFGARNKRKATKSDSNKVIFSELEVLFNEMSAYQLKKVRAKLNKAFNRKVKRKNFRLYGNMQKGFTEDELDKFFSHILLPDEERLYVAYKLQALLGLRSGETVLLKLSDIDWEERTLRISTEKAKTIDYLHLHDEIFNLLKKFTEKNRSELEQKDGFLLFSRNGKRTVISAAYLRSKFREICRRANLTETYAIADDFNNPRLNHRKLYRLSTHSLRHYFITKVYNACKDPIKTRCLARHKKLNTTEGYIYTSSEELNAIMKESFRQDD